jgi:hypothetical protein
LDHVVCAASARPVNAIKNLEKRRGFLPASVNQVGNEPKIERQL